MKVTREMMRRIKTDVTVVSTAKINVPFPLSPALIQKYLSCHDYYIVGHTCSTINNWCITTCSFHKQRTVNEVCGIKVTPNILVHTQYCDCIWDTMHIIISHTTNSSRGWSQVQKSTINRYRWKVGTVNWNHDSYICIQMIQRLSLIPRDIHMHLWTHQVKCEL